jgi:hypothetical protein
MIARPTRECLEHSKYLANDIYHAQSVQVFELDWRYLPTWNFLVSFSDFNNPLNHDPVPPIWNGYQVNKIDTQQQPQQVIVLRSGDQLSFSLNFNEDTNLIALHPLGDTISWHHKLDLLCTLHTQNQKAQSIIKGYQIPRMRASPPPFLLDKPLLLKQADTLNVQLLCNFRD